MVVVVGDCRTRGELKSCSVAGESHMLILLKTIRDSRRMHSSLHFQLCPSLISHEAKQKLRSDVCKMASHKAYNHRRTVRF